MRISVVIMKLILIQDVPKIGRKYEIKEVKDGFARNFLMARNLAIPWTLEAEKSFSLKIKQAEETKKSRENDLEKNLDLLNDFKIIFSRKANNEGHLFAGIKSEDIVKFLEKEKGIIIPENILEMSQPIKTLGEHKIKARNKILTVEVQNEKTTK